MPWKRILLASCLLGTLTVVGIAWRIAWAAPATTGTNMGYGKRRATEANPDPFPDKWYVLVVSSRGRVCKEFRVDTGWELDDDAVERFESLAGDAASRAAMRRHAFLLSGKDARFVSFSVTAYGWPLSCLALEDAFTSTDAQFTRMMIMDFRADPKEAYSGDPRNTLRAEYASIVVRGHSLPARPLLMPFAVNLTLFSAAWLAVLTGAWLLCTRRRRGVCPTCRYCLAGLPPHAPCPECGTPPAKSRTGSGGHAPA